MNQKNYNIIGIMSGTSLDGVDLAHIHFETINQKWNFQLLDCKTISYDSYWIETLKKAVTFDEKQLQKLNKDYTILLAKIINDFIEDYKITALDAICSHGHTILHQPQNGFTLQIGNLPELAVLTRQKTVCDFRVQDVQLGGQGAPLVPIGDKILFSNYDYCLNLGGFSNISFDKNGVRIAFDISPVNTVLNYYAEKLGFSYDDKGKIAKTGSVHQSLLSKLNHLEYYQKNFPKSLGFEFVKEVILPIIESSNLKIEDKMRTFIEHIAQQIKKALPQEGGAIFITGGGAYNDFLIETIQRYLPKNKIIIPENKILEYKEALIFGLLGVLKLREEINVLASVTGAKMNHSSGKTYNYF